MVVVQLMDNPEFRRRRAEAAIERANYYFYTKQEKDAIPFYEAVIGNLGRPPIMAYDNLSRCYFLESRFRDAVEIVEKGLEIHPDSIDLLLRLAMMHSDQFQEIRNPFKAVKYLSRIKELCPEFSEKGMSIDTMLMYAEACADIGSL